jgi:SAM-dependent methyltransferase
MKTRIVSSDGSSTDVSQWTGEPSDEDRELLRRVRPPVLDIGCGPGRHVLALAGQGIPALGIDIAPSAVEIARAKGASVIERSLFARVPGHGRWGSSLLLDGNVGIGGDPWALFRRVHSLLRPRGRLLVETHDPSVTTTRLHVRVESGSDVTVWIPWARVGAGDVPALAAATGYRVEDSWSRNGRWFACLVAR